MRFFRGFFFEKALSKPTQIFTWLQINGMQDQILIQTKLGGKRVLLIGGGLKDVCISLSRNLWKTIESWRTNCFSSGHVPKMVDTFLRSISPYQCFRRGFKWWVSSLLLVFLLGAVSKEHVEESDVLRSQGFLLASDSFLFNAAKGSLKPRIDHANYISESRWVLQVHDARLPKRNMGENLGCFVSKTLFLC